MAFQLTHTQIRVEGNDQDIIFSNLMINQQLADVNSFGFTWRQPEGESSLSAHVSFYSDHLSKEITITIGDNYTFKGIIFAITCNNHESIGVSYEISGKGLFEKLDHVPECRSFYKKNLTQIFNAVNHTSGTTLTLSPSNTSELFYTVQYNQTGFAFFKMLATRYGEWLYYNGTEMVLGAPAGDAITLNQGEDVTEVDISARLVRAPQNNTAFDRHSGEEITHQPQSGNNNNFIGAAVQGGETAYGSNQSMTHMNGAANPQVLTDMSDLAQKAAAASAVTVRARSNNPTLKLASKIKIMDTAGHSVGEYFITEIHHASSNDSHYHNQFVAIPAEAQVPPYTDPKVVTVCKAQPAKIVDNEDKDGLDRVKVHFPWQDTNDTTPWLNVVTPHAGKDKGIRFLPETGEEVLVDFLDNNAERPFVLGAVHTEKNKSGNNHTGNNLKVIGTKTGRRLEIDDKGNSMRLYDNYTEKTPKNGILFKRTDSDTQLLLESQKDTDNYTIVAMTNKDSLNLGVVKGGSIILEIKMESDDKKITIHSTGSIELNADDSISLNAKNINIKATQDISIASDTKAVNIKGMEITVEADTNVKIKGVNTSVEGAAQAELKASGITSVTGSIVKIN